MTTHVLISNDGHYQVEVEVVHLAHAAEGVQESFDPAVIMKPGTCRQFMLHSHQSLRVTETQPMTKGEPAAPAA